MEQCGMKVLAIGAHPDDESFAGGLLAKYATEGHDVHILLATRGEGGSAGDPPLCERSELGARREQEARAAARELGAVEMEFLPFRDTGRNEQGELQQLTALPEEFSAAIAAHLRRIEPDVVITHGTNGEYGHPQHVFTHQAVFHALEQVRPWRPSQVMTWQAAHPNREHEGMLNRDDPADLVIDVSDWLPQKVAALDAHKTQHAGFFRSGNYRTLEEIAGRIESYRRWSSFEKDEGA
jgi:N-acetylglucosamine malate deacetylase 2